MLSFVSLTFCLSSLSFPPQFSILDFNIIGHSWRKHWYSSAAHDLGTSVTFKRWKVSCVCWRVKLMKLTRPSIKTFRKINEISLLCTKNIHLWLMVQSRLQWGMNLLVLPMLNSIYIYFFFALRLIYLIVCKLFVSSLGRVTIVKQILDFNLG